MNTFTRGRVIRGLLLVVLLVLAVVYGYYDLTDIPWLILGIIAFVVVGEVLSRSYKERPEVMNRWAVGLAIGAFLAVLLFRLLVT